MAARNSHRAPALWMALLALPFLTSCLKEVVNPKLPQSEVRLSLQCYLTPDDSVSRAFLYLTRPLIGTFKDGESEYPKGPRILVTDGTDTAWFERRVNQADQRQGFYMVLKKEAMALVPGRTYTVIATDTLGRRAWGACTIPAELPPAPSLTLARFTSPEFGFESIEAKVKWPRQTGGAYYRAQAFLQNYGEFPWDPDSAGVQEYPLSLTEGSSEFLKEESFTGDSVFTAFSGGLFNEGGVFDSSAIRVNLLQTDEAYYNFHTSLNRYEGENFFSEPIQVYSNVQNGVGVVSAYRVRSVRIRVQ